MSNKKMYRSKLKYGFTWGTRCHYCNVLLHMGSSDDLKGYGPATRDHIVPRAIGGSTHPRNLVWACKRCNATKSDKIPTCTCEKCCDAVLHHAEWVAGFHPSLRIGMVIQGQPVFEAYGVDIQTFIRNSDLFKLLQDEESEESFT